MTTYSAVRTTGIYCRPGCGARPRAENVTTFELAAAAEAAGFRACLRCRPYRVAGEVSPTSPELVCRAVRLVLDGALDDATEEQLGHRIGVSARHLRRLFHEHLGVTPTQLALSRRAHFARRLLDDSDLSIAQIAFASGFGSIRHFNRAMREVFRSSPKELRDRRRRHDRLLTDGGLGLRIPYEQPYDFGAALSFLAARVIPGVDSVEDGTYRRTIMLDGGPGVLELSVGGPDHLVLVAHLPYWEGLIHVVSRAAQVAGIGLEQPGAWGSFEAGVQLLAVQSSAQSGLGGLVRSLGTFVPGLTHGLAYAFPSAEVVASADVEALGLPATVRELAVRVHAGEVRLDGAASLDELISSLLSIPDVEPTTAHALATRLGYQAAVPIGLSIT
ncbi:helix-turn-helix domain-containing protein [Tenggerimyces flavus]|uniref:Helix-turn-helix domain-containing protein n=1 Tax=Tenggerimyces flavus TaxID=1708749 RepID=A0ABV7Y630_9ACTN|nr:helix-turn-helix domain-containing protein [Tenggerimyces flavus]MBM7788381.1 AraC family transcriptional regulator of adaptative response / DNA-3-methyladenine glycosylase II [Tenggerimyces flavus]